MSAQNLDSLAGQGEFHAKKPGAEPLTHQGVSHLDKKNHLSLPRSMLGRTLILMSPSKSAQARSQSWQRRRTRIQCRGAQGGNSAEQERLHAKHRVRSARTSPEPLRDGPNRCPEQPPWRHFRLGPQRDTVWQARARRVERRATRRPEADRHRNRGSHPTRPVYGDG